MGMGEDLETVVVMRRGIHEGWRVNGAGKSTERTFVYLCVDSGIIEGVEFSYMCKFFVYKHFVGRYRSEATLITRLIPVRNTEVERDRF